MKLLSNIIAVLVDNINTSFIGPNKIDKLNARPAELKTPPQERTTLTPATTAYSNNLIMYVRLLETELFV
jgi:hypothetical protein